MESWKILANQEIEAIHNATLRVLSQVGIFLSHPGICERLKANGATLEGERVLLPPDLVEQAIRTSGKKVTIRGRGGSTITLFLSG